MNEISDSAVIEFLGLYLAEREAGAARPLVEYLALFPGHEEAIAGAFLSATRGVDETAGAASSAGAERIGPFTLLRELGRGGQGAVWLARDERLERLVALKITPRSPLFDELSPRFQREAKAASRLDHPGICSVYDIGADERVAWIAMRFVEGRTLASRLADAPALDGSELATRLTLLEKTARALHYAHEAGVVHRDVKPSNVMVTDAGEPVILDFGIARDSDDGAPVTLSGDALGTPAYMAPEELGLARRGNDRRCDVWSLGVTAYEALTGARPFAAPTREGLVRAILESEPVDPRRASPLVSRDLAVVLATALAKDPARRYQTALDLAEDLRRVRDDEPIRARAATRWDKLSAWMRRNPALAASLIALFVVLSSALALTAGLLKRTRSVLDSRERLLGDVTQLSDSALARELLSQVSQLWPLREKELPRFDAWLERADRVLARTDRHVAAREQIAVRTDLDADPERNAEARAWLLGQLDDLIASLGSLRDARELVAMSREFAATVRARTVDDYRVEWERVRAEVRAEPRYKGLDLAPQVGLVPLGRDPRSGWQEFALLETGVVPARDAASGVLVRSDETALVLVLLPGGSVDMGCELPSESRPLGSPNADPNAARWDGPVVRAELDPFFLSKFEMTQGQWLHHTGNNPSVYQLPSKLISKERPLSHPIEHVSWDDACRELPEMGLSLPTEARWEYALRAGTTTPWITGESFEGIDQLANLADRFALENHGADNWKYEPTLNDGFVSHTLVGSFRPNAWGFHDILGNVEEWCLDTWEDLAAVKPRARDGLLVGEEGACVLRGGSYNDHPIDARSGYRTGNPSNMSTPSWGLRPARELEP